MTKKFFLKDRKFELLGIRPEAREADYPLPSTIESPPFLGKWAVLNYYLPDGLMHPDDADKFLNAKQKGEHIYRCTKEEKEWVTITNDCGYSYRVNSARVIWIPKPDFAIGQEVVTTNGTFRKGKIKSRGWHFKEMCFTFCIEIEGNNGIWKAHKRRYWAHDLRLVPTNNMKKPQV